MYALTGLFVPSTWPDYTIHSLSPVSNGLAICCTLSAQAGHAPATIEFISWRAASAAASWSGVSVDEGS